MQLWNTRCTFSVQGICGGKQPMHAASEETPDEAPSPVSSTDVEAQMEREAEAQVSGAAAKLTTT